MKTKTSKGILETAASLAVIVAIVAISGLNLVM